MRAIENHAQFAVIGAGAKGSSVPCQRVKPGWRKLVPGERGPVPRPQWPCAVARLSSGERT